MTLIKKIAVPFVALSVGCAGGTTATPPTSPAGGQPAPPRLTVLVVVDQLRADLLTEYAPVFSQGLRRLLADGRVYSQVTHDHAVTETSPGHATISTGTHPSRHGLVSNQWFESVEGSWALVLNVEDPNYERVGPLPINASAAPAGAPDRLERTGVADWILADNDRSRVVSLAGKARSAVLLAGKSESDVYWYDEELGRFGTSTYYTDELPDWVSAYNEDQLAALRSDTIWESTVPPSDAPRSRPDTAEGEGDGIHTAFPHIASLEGYALDGGYWVGDTPDLDVAVLGLARAAVAERQLGADAVPDLLALGLSAVDRVGHAYGPRSREQLDNLLRLDRQLGAFLDFLDERVGVGEYTVVLSADHGVVDLPEANPAVGSRLTVEDRQTLEALLGGLVRETLPDGPVATARGIADGVTDIPWIRAAWAVADLDTVADSLGVLQRNSYYPGRPTGVLGRFGVVYQLPSGTLDWNWPLGTHHGSPYYHDRHVPLVFYGYGIEPGSDDRPVATVDIAPTLADLLGIAWPSDLDGTPLTVSR